MKILNLTQHAATHEQLAMGVIDVRPEWRPALVELLTFDDLPTREEISARAYELTAIFAAYDMSGNDDDDGEYPRHVMIGGAPFFMSALEAALLDHNIQPVYAFSKRESVEVTDADGNVRKTSVFKHVGFIQA